MTHSLKEATLLLKFEKAKLAFDEADRELNDYFMGLAQLPDNDEKSLSDLIRRCPDSVTKVFLMDSLRQYLEAHFGSISDAVVQPNREASTLNEIREILTRNGY